MTAPLPIEVPAWKIVDLGPLGEQHIYRFANGYGASVIRGQYTYGGLDGLYEAAVIGFRGDKWGIISDDVAGYLTIGDVAALLAAIAAAAPPLH